MASTPTQPPKPPQPQHQPPKPHQPEPPHREPEARKPAPEALPIGAKPKDPRDPQAAKFEAHAVPPRWQDPANEMAPPPAWTPEPALDPRAQKPPEGVYADGMPIADEQRARAAYVEAHGVEAYAREADQRPDADKPRIDKHALAGGAAYVSAGTQRQVPGVTPPTKRE